MLKDLLRRQGRWWRPWLLVAGAAFGAATGVKWNGVFFLAAFGVFVLVVDVVRRGRRGETRGWWAALWRHGLLDFVQLVPISALVYTATWTGWFATSGGLDRQWAETPGNAWGGALGWVPRTLQSWLHLQVAMVADDAAFDRHLGQESAPITWLFWLHPSHSWNLQLNPGSPQTCGASACGLLVVDLPNPLLWICALVAVLVLLVTLWRRRSWAEGAVLLAIGAGYVPWLLVTRTTFSQYVLAFLPFMYLALVLVLRRIAQRRESPGWRRGSRLWTAGFVLLATLVSAWFLPVWIAIWIPVVWMRSLIWLPDWRATTYLYWNTEGLNS